MLHLNPLLVLAASMATLVSGLTTPMAYGYPTLRDVQQKFSSECVVPDVLASFNPTAFLYLTYTGNLSDGTTAKVVLPGTSFARNDTLSTPQFSVDGVKNGTYVIAIVDPDAPSRANPIVSQIRHMFATNFTISNTRSNFVPRGMVMQNSTAAISPYFPPNPPAGSGAHRYIALLYAQPSNFDLSLFNVSSVSNFNISAFATSSGLGEPLAGTFLTVENKA